jgi:hypothetical protein
LFYEFNEYIHKNNLIQIYNLREKYIIIKII